MLTIDPSGFYTTSKYFKDKFGIDVEKFSKCYLQYTKEFDTNDVGAEKDSRIIFEKALQSFNLMAEESVFIDNRRSNLNVADSMGLRTILFDDRANDVDKLKSQLSDLGVNV